MSAPLSSRLLFCLYSFLFGVGAAVLASLLRSVFTALRLLPCTEKRGRIASAFRLPSIRKEKKKRLFFIGYFFYDFLCGIGFFSLYMLFLYAYGGGALRLYAFLLSLLGLWLAKRPVSRLFAFPCDLLGAVLRLIPYCVYRILKRLRGKGGKKLDENGNMV